MSGSASPRLWYVAYASNLALERLRCYLRGGRVAGGTRVYPGCRDPQDPADSTPLHVPGGLVFAGRSRVWRGGIAFHDPDAAGTVACRGHLVTRAQLADVVAQETRQPPGGEFARHLEGLLPHVDGHVRTWGPGLYDTVYPVGDRDGVPMVTVTHREVASMTPVAPTAPYLRWIVAGLRETHGWEDDRIGCYLAEAPGFRAGWTPEAITAL
jgi:hypothetical protein